MRRHSVYFDLCALKRGWDNQTQLRVKLEADAVHALLVTARLGRIAFVHSTIHDVENATNKNRDRRASVQQLLETTAVPSFDHATLDAHMERLLLLGFGTMDAAHLAAAQTLGADVFVTTDDLLRRRASRLTLGLRVVGPIEYAAEVAS